MVAEGVRFDERFGAGADWSIGDEYIFLADLLRKKLSGRHVALPLAIHPRLSSGIGFDAGSLETRRAGVPPGGRAAVVSVPRRLRVQELGRFPSLRAGMTFVRIGY